MPGNIVLCFCSYFSKSAAGQAGHTSTLGAILQPWGPYSNLGGHVLVTRWIFLAVESTGLETMVQNHYYILWEELSEQLDKLQNCSGLFI